MNKHFLIIGILILVSFKSFSQKDYTFCYGSIALTIFDGGDAEMIRYNSSRNAVSKVKGTFDLYGKGNSTELLKILFQGTEYRYDLIRDGFGTPSVVIDGQGRRYVLCKTKDSGDDGKSNAEMMAEMAQISKERDKFQKEYSARVAATKITPFSVFKGKWIRNDEQVSIKITEIPYSLKFNNSSLKYEYSDSLKTWELPNSIEKDLRFQPGEKKILLKLTIDKPGFLSDFVGIVVERDVVINSQIIYPPYTFLDFVNKYNNKMISFKITPKNSIQKGELIYSEFIKGEWIRKGIFSGEYSGWSGPFNLILEQKKIVLPQKNYPNCSNSIKRLL